MRHQERIALFIEWWVNLYPILMKNPEARRICGQPHEPDWRVIYPDMIEPDKPVFGKEGHTKLDDVKAANEKLRLTEQAKQGK